MISPTIKAPRFQVARGSAPKPVARHVRVFAEEGRNPNRDMYTKDVVETVKENVSAGVEKAKEAIKTVQQSQEKGDDYRASAYGKHEGEKRLDDKAKYMAEQAKKDVPRSQ